ncbi:tyrosine-type recombinase/integrase [Rubrivirga marina]|uniref:tyrosine-type recombinase/integrase n=1 Tax=Rubrivirga marina TaxID=1196024 RepID=UPI000BA9A2F4|nr:tyrosine-type recombinase/integrase [Rubrivirga marina]
MDSHDRALPASVDAGTHAKLGRAFTAQSDLVPLYLLRYDRENTRRAYAKDLETFFGCETVTLEMAASVTFTDVNEALQTLESDGKSPATQRRFLASLRGFFGWLAALGFIDLNPADRHLVRRIPKTSDADQLVTVLTREQAARMLGAIDMTKPSGARNFALVTTLLHCVLRRSEASDMDVEDIGMAGEHTILRLKRAKGGANQTVKVPDHVAGVLRDFIRSSGYHSGPVWRSLSTNHSHGKRLSGSAIYKIVRSLGRQAGIQERVGAHTLRHTGCTLAIEGGASLQQVQAHARHKNIETTMRYVHQRDRLANSAADFIDL